MGLLLLVLPASAADAPSGSATERIDVEAVRATTSRTAFREASVGMRGVSGGITSCYNRALDEDSKLRAALRLLIRVGQDGAVTGLSILGQEIPEELASCLKQPLSTLSFSPHEQEDLWIKVPLNLFQCNQQIPTL